jgi:hypothetical protein
MSITIHPELEATLRARAEEQGITIDAYLERLIRPKARREINDILVYYIETAGIGVARRFRKAAKVTCLHLPGACV